MHLKLLKLAGFKSFVDPTVIPFPSQLVAVVGPNGCGKSNIIDAVRWVMGESSAKNLRGESMIDVIFNGSTQRKAVGQASIELVFDNSLGRLNGQYASYQEISVKRILTRDGESAYFLNNSRCRRRDITDIFLGTGAGARGYSVISQGTISRIIEARPEELRVYLEEAAGISKYKERRRETLSRIEQTRENLLRVADIREELAKQLQRLEQQAKTAARYKTLKSEERLCKLEILALKWRALTAEQEKKQAELRHLILAYEKHQANAAEAFKNSSELREQGHSENELFQAIQGNFYRMATEIARLEEGIKQHQREQQQLTTDQNQRQMDWQTISDQVTEEEKTLADSQSCLLKLEKNLQDTQSIFNHKQQNLKEKQAQQASWNNKNQSLQAALNKSLAQAQVEDLRLQHLAERRQQIVLRLEKIDDESASLATDDLSETIDSQQTLLKNLQNQQQIAQEKHQQRQVRLNLAREQLATTKQAVHQAQDEIHRLRTEQASLAAAQKMALGQEETKLTNLASWADKPRLVEIISVEKNWQLACELVLAESLQAIMLDSLDVLWKEIHHMQANSAIFMSYSPSEEKNSNHPRLSDKIKGPKPSWIHCLDKIYTASSLEEALACLVTLKPEESVITQEGCWLAKGWVKIAGSAKQSISLIQVQEELKVLSQRLASAENDLFHLKIKRNELLSQVNENEAALELEKQALFNSREDLRACETSTYQKSGLLEQAKVRKNALADESENLRFSLEELAIQQEEAIQKANSAKDEAKQYNDELAQLTSEKTIEDQIIEKNRSELEDARAAENQIQLQAERERLKIAQLINNLKKERVSLASLQTHLESLAKRLTELKSPDLDLQKTLEVKIIQHNELENELNQCKERLNKKTEQLESWEILVKSEEKFAKNLQEKIQEERLQEQKLAVQAGSVLESLNELEGQVEAILEAIPATINQAKREQELVEFGAQIASLGAINLAAIDEYESEFQRKQHLDNQYQDLIEALSMLEAAIEKMDQETNQRLQNTFNDLNTAFQSLFPRLFGGGRAMLELTCDNLLEAGVLVMAQPPGKRNSTIHLLSGGEKAMTAVALVFAIFQLNPSPFCLLDEVDAPLDDVNVGRFCNLVKEMSQFVQFLFITHNKVTMELADHLIGVTMREPGVSRIVTVAVEEALAMTEA